MLDDFTWDMRGYIPRYPISSSANGITYQAAERIFQLEPEPPAVTELNDYILAALEKKDLKYFSFFLHHYESQLNQQLKTFFGTPYKAECFLDMKLSCREQMLQKLMDYDPAKGAGYAAYIYPFLWDAMLRFRMGEEKWSVSSLTSYKMMRTMAYLYHNTKDAVTEFAQKYNCDLALAEEYLKVVRGIRNEQPFYVTDEDGEETGEGVVRAVRIKQKSKTKRKKKIAAAVYEYQADCDGEWGEISLNFETSTAEIIWLADWDTTISNFYARKVIRYLLGCNNDKLPKESMFAFEEI